MLSDAVLCHLVGDYILQTDRMANSKRSSWAWAVFHAATYTLPFALLSRSPWRLGVIFGTHAVIDRLGLARYVVASKNASTDWKNRANYFRGADGRMTMTGYPPEMPSWMAVWLLIVADNTLHLVINRFALQSRERQIP